MMILELLQKSMKMKFSIGFNAWTACYNDKDFRLYQQDDLEYYKLSEIRLSIYPDFEAARAPLIG